MSYSNGPKMFNNNLVFCVDAAHKKSYPGSGNYWYDLINNNIGYIGNNGVHEIDYYNSTYSPQFTNDNGGTFLFDGVDDHVVFPDSPSLRYFGSNLSVFSWAKPTIDVTTSRNIVARRNVSNIGGYILHNSGNNSLLCYVFRSSWGAASSANVYEPNIWCYVGFTYDGSQMKLYKNGKYLTAANLSGDVNPVESTMRIGSNGRTSQPWAGHIANVHIYNSALTNDQVLQNYNTLKGRFGL